MAFPTIPTVAASRVLFQLALSPAGTMPSRSLAILFDAIVGFPWVGAPSPSASAFLHIAAVTVDP